MQCFGVGIHEGHVRELVPLSSLSVNETGLAVSQRHEIGNVEEVLLGRLQFGGLLDCFSKLEHAGVLGILQLGSHAHSVAIIAQEILTDTNALTTTLLKEIHYYCYRT